MLALQILRLCAITPKRREVPEYRGLFTINYQMNVRFPESVDDWVRDDIFEMNRVTLGVIDSTFIIEGEPLSCLEFNPPERNFPAWIGGKAGDSFVQTLGSCFFERLLAIAETMPRGWFSISPTDTFARLGDKKWELLDRTGSLERLLRTGEELDPGPVVI